MPQYILRNTKTALFYTEATGTPGFFTIRRQDATVMEHTKIDLIKKQFKEIADFIQAIPAFDPMLYAALINCRNAFDHALSFTPTIKELDENDALMLNQVFSEMHALRNRIDGRIPKIHK